ncbi:MAG: Asp-tRNA(Asn)/Glu-tRNA(Gln) amidotransferase subunit GatC [Candidatus Komeilibacteria bacterium]
MSLDSKQIEYLAELAKLSVSNEEKDKFARQLNDILEYLSQLSDVKDLSVTDKFVDPVKTINVWRDDEVKDSDEDVKKTILDNAPALRDDLVETKPVFKKHE